MSTPGRHGRVATAIVLGVVGVVVVIGMLATFAGESARSRAAEPGSVANRDDEGAFGFAGVLNRLGWRIGYVDDRYDEASLPDEGTVVVFTPTRVRRGEPDALLRWVRASDRRRVVLVGTEDGALRDTLVPGLRDAPADTATRPVPATGGPLTDGIRALGTPTRVGWAPVGTSGDSGDDGDGIEPVYVLGVDGGDGVDDAPWYVVRRRFPGGGEVIAVREAAPLTNDGIVRGANAAFATRLALPGIPTVHFDEFHHTPPGGGGLLDAAPSDVRALAVQLVLVFALLVAARAVRFGPPLQMPDRPPPRRVGHVDAVARALLRSGGGDAEAYTLVRHDLHVRLLRRSRLSPDAPAADLVDAAVALGCDRHKVTAALFGDASSGSASAVQLSAWAAECRAVIDRPPVAPA